MNCLQMFSSLVLYLWLLRQFPMYSSNTSHKLFSHNIKYIYMPSSFGRSSRAKRMHVWSYLPSVLIDGIIKCKCSTDRHPEYPSKWVKGAWIGPSFCLICLPISQIGDSSTFWRYPFSTYHLSRYPDRHIVDLFPIIYIYMKFLVLL